MMSLSAMEQEDWLNLHTNIEEELSTSSSFFVLITIRR